jgi:hypothetical protein
MLSHQSIKRLLAGGLVIAAAGFPSAAQARYIEDAGGSPSASQVPVAGPQPASQAVAVRSGQGGGSFQWGDAGIGAAGAVVLMSAGALGTGVARRRRVQRPAVG